MTHWNETREIIHATFDTAIYQVSCLHSDLALRRAYPATDCGFRVKVQIPFVSIYRRFGAPSDPIPFPCLPTRRTNRTLRHLPATGSQSGQSSPPSFVTPQPRPTAPTAPRDGCGSWRAGNGLGSVWVPSHLSPNPLAPFHFPPLNTWPGNSEFQL